ncbi:prepilin peptidase-dependent protein B [Escherichia coli]|uniref:Prepilin peptidase-dependent protein B n=1 Tax=Escherichia coli TaxID=562 RepID=A0A377D8U8_ECOLX|nr:prepilin peptidase-dependent protein B [Escherichia coli]
MLWRSVAYCLLGAARFLPALQRDSLTSTRKLALEDEIWLRVFTVAKHLQRAGYCHGSCTGEGLEIVGQGDCVIVQWDANSNGIWDREPVKESDQIGFRPKEHVLETLRGATSCEDKGWDKVTNPDAIIVDTFQVTRQDVSGFLAGVGRLICTLPARLIRKPWWMPAIA